MAIPTPEKLKSELKVEFQMESLGIQDPVDAWSRVVSVRELALRCATSRLPEEATELGRRRPEPPPGTMVPECTR